MIIDHSYYSTVICITVLVITDHSYSNQYLIVIMDHSYSNQYLIVIMDHSYSNQYLIVIHGSYRILYTEDMFKKFNTTLILTPDTMVTFSLSLEVEIIYSQTSLARVTFNAQIYILCDYIYTLCITFADRDIPRPIIQTLLKAGSGSLVSSFVLESS